MYPLIPSASASASIITQQACCCTWPLHAADGDSHMHARKTLKSAALACFERALPLASSSGGSVSTQGWSSSSIGICQEIKKSACIRATHLAEVNDQNFVRQLFPKFVFDSTWHQQQWRWMIVVTLIAKEIILICLKLCLCNSARGVCALACAIKAHKKAPLPADARWFLCVYSRRLCTRCWCESFTLTWYGWLANTWCGIVETQWLIWRSESC